MADVGTVVTAEIVDVARIAGAAATPIAAKTAAVPPVAGTSAEEGIAVTAGVSKPQMKPDKDDAKGRKQKKDGHRIYNWMRVG